MLRTWDLVAFSHLRWDFVYQRPQHLLSRLAARRRVFFVEEPLPGGPTPAWELRQEGERITVCRPRLELRTPGFSAGHMPALAELVGRLRQEQGVTESVAWLYTPLALPLIDTLEPHAVVYDCMDELSAFLHAPPQLRQ